MNSQTQPPWARRFFSIWVGQTLSLLGTSIAQFAIVWYLTQQTGSATVLATATLVSILPNIILGPFIGALVDRWNRRWVIILADIANIVITGALAVAFVVGDVALPVIYLGMMLRSASASFRETAMGASIIMLVPEKHLTRIQGVNRARQGLMNIMAAPLGALLLSAIPIQAILTIDWVSTMFAIAPLLLFAIPQPTKHADAAPTSVGQDVREGLRFVAGWRGFMVVLGMAMLLNLLLNPTFALLPLLVTKHFNGDALQLASLEVAFGVGVIIGGVLLGVWGGFKSRIGTALLGLMGMGAGVLLIGLAPATVLGLAVAGMVVTGLMQPICDGSFSAVMQRVIPPEMQGRVFALMFALSAAMSPLGLIFAGPISDLTGIRMWYLISGVACLAMALVGFASRSVMNIERDRPAAAQPVPAPSAADMAAYSAPM